MSAINYPSDIQELLVLHTQWLDRSSAGWEDIDRLYEDRLRNVVNANLEQNNEGTAITLAGLILENIEFTIKEDFTLSSQDDLINNFFVLMANNNAIAIVAATRPAANTIVCIAMFKLACFEEDSAARKIKKMKKKDIAVPDALYETLSQWTGKQVHEKNMHTAEHVVDLFYGPAIWDLATTSLTSLLDVPSHIWHLHLPIAFMQCTSTHEAELIPHDLLV